MLRLAGAAVALGAAMLLAGCAVEYEVPYHETAEAFSIDPVTGHLIRTTTWTNSGGGGFVVTRDDITANGNQDRRGPGPTRGLLTLP